MIYLLPVVIGILQGYFLLTAMIPVDVRPRAPLLLFWGALTGLGTTGFLTFSSLIVCGQIVPAYVISINLAAVIGLFFLARTRGLALPFGKQHWDTPGLIGLHLVILAMVPVFLHARLFPYGGWDAWSCWNLKAVMLFNAGDDWKRMFEPLLWRSNTAYPFLLPLINVWSWCFGTDASLGVTLMTSCRITLLTGLLLFFGLRELKAGAAAMLAPLWMLSIMFVVKLASSQYSDLLLGAWLLSALLAFKLFCERRAPGYLALMALSLGFMSFTKSEGQVLAGITLFWAGVVLAVSNGAVKAALRGWKGIIAAFIVGFVPTAVFLIFWAPNSHTFVNGLTTTAYPAPWERLQAAIVFLGIEMISLKWNGLWIIAAVSVIAALGRAWRNNLWVIPAVLLTYLAALMAVYAVNTFFPIVWWLSTTLNRLLFALIPAVIFWVFLLG